MCLLCGFELTRLLSKREVQPTQEQALQLKTWLRIQKENKRESFDVYNKNLITSQFEGLLFLDKPCILAIMKQELPAHNFIT